MVHHTKIKVKSKVAPGLKHHALSTHRRWEGKTSSI